MNKKIIDPTYISLFSSAGVGCYGLEKAGFRCVATNELLERRLQIQKFNKLNGTHDDCFVLGSILNDDVKDRILELANDWRDKSGRAVDILVATPPCQGISVANHKKNDADHNRNSLVVESIVLTKEILPKVFVFENVRGFLNTLCTDRDGVDKTISAAIDQNLSSFYNITSRIVNFKNYGVPSSRTRTLVIGTLKSESALYAPFFFPFYESTVSLREAIGHLSSLKTMGELCPDDFLHNFKRYDEKMIPWVSELREGESSFDNVKIEKRPHSLDENGNILLNANKNADKYKRQVWSEVGPCIHTRNDIFSSQNTIHPLDNRVFSIRELMILMSIPSSFNWFAQDFDTINDLNYHEKDSLLRKAESNIRQSLGEAVPTKVFFDIANNYLNVNRQLLSSSFQAEDFLVIQNLFDIYFPSDNFNQRPFNVSFRSTSKALFYFLVTSSSFNKLQNVGIDLSPLHQDALKVASLPKDFYLLSEDVEYDFILIDDSSCGCVTLDSQIKINSIVLYISKTVHFESVIRPDVQVLKSLPISADRTLAFLKKASQLSFF